MNRGVIIVLIVLVVLGIIAGSRLLHVANEARFNEAVAYFDLPESPKKPELIRLRITAKVPEPEIKSRIEQHRREVRDILLRTIAPGPGREQALRDSRRAILKVLGLENKTKAVAIDVVPDFSAMPHNREIRELLEKAHSAPTPEERTGSPFQ